MKLVGRGLIVDFSQKHPKARKPLAKWVKTVENASFKHFPELKHTFRTADYDAPFTIFDIAGNNFRLIAVVVYEVSTVAVRKVMTHDEYMRGNWRAQLR